MNGDKRIVERLHIPTDKWHRVKMINLKKGDVFRMFDPDGTPIKEGKETIFTAATDAQLSAAGVAGVKVKV